MTDTQAKTDPPPPADSVGSKDSVGSAQQARWLLVALGVVVLVALFLPRGEGRKVPGGFLLDDGGRPTPLASQMASTTLVHFWATWCPPCIDEIPALQRLSRDYAADPDIRVVFIAVDDTREQVARFFGSEAANVLYDPEWEVANRFGTDKLPESYLVVEGRVVEKFVGATDWDDPSVRARLPALPGPDPAG